MRNNGSFEKVVVDTARDNKERFDLPSDCNTTASIGDLQPIMYRSLRPKSKASFKQRHLVRLAPMVVPTFGRLKAKYWNMFVGMSDLLPRSYGPLLTKVPINGSDASTLPSVPAELPHMSLADISLMALVGCSMTVYFHDPIGSEGPDDSYTRWRTYLYNANVQAVTDFKAWIASYVGFGSVSGFTGFTGGAFDPSMFGTQYGSTPVQAYVPFNAAGSSSVSDIPARFLERSTSLTGPNVWEPVSLSSADYTIRTSFTQGANSYEVCFAIRLSAFGKRLRKILIGLGYAINFTGVHDSLDLSRLCAYYKAYFDTFGLTLDTNWESTACNRLLTSWDNQSSTNYFTWIGSAGYAFRQFVYDLGTTYVTESHDYISAHLPTDAVGPNNSSSVLGVWADKTRGFLNEIVLSTPSAPGTGVTGISQFTGSIQPASVQPNTQHVYINRVDHTQVDSMLLKTLYKWTNRETVAGKRIEELLIAGGYGDYVKQCKSNFVGYDEIDIDVTDINATADSTNSATNHNSVVGEYVGKGVGVTQGDAKDFTFENDEAGYLFTLFAIVPESGYCQGLDLTLLDVDADHIYNRDFDGLGMEMQPMSVVVASSDWQSKYDSSDYAKSFGMVPRLTRYKVAQNICNGDFSLKSTRANYLPFSLDKFLDLGNRTSRLDNIANYQYFTQLGAPISSAPISGNSWRYLNRYFWLNNFERIFTAFISDDDAFKRFVIEMNNQGAFELCYQMYDHFVCQNIIDLTTWESMLPSAESWGTTDENNGHGDKVMKKA